MSASTDASNAVEPSDQVPVNDFGFDAWFAWNCPAEHAALYGDQTRLPQDVIEGASLLRINMSRCWVASRLVLTTEEVPWLRPS